MTDSVSLLANNHSPFVPPFVALCWPKRMENLFLFFFAPPRGENPIHHAGLDARGPAVHADLARRPSRQGPVRPSPERTWSVEVASAM